MNRGLFAFPVGHREMGMYGFPLGAAGRAMPPETMMETIAYRRIDLRTLSIPPILDSISNWYDPSVPGALATDSQGNVSRWYDLSGHGRDAFQDTAANQATIRGDSKIGPLQGVRFDGSNDNYEVPFDIRGPGDDYTCFVVFRCFSFPASQYILGPLANNGFPTFVNTSGRYNVFDRAGGVAFAIDTAVEPARAGVPQIGAHRCISSANRFDVWRNHRRSVGFFNPSARSSTTMRLGASEAAANVINGCIGEMVFYDRLLEDSEVWKTLAYLGDKWHVQDREKPDA